MSNFRRASARVKRGRRSPIAKINCKPMKARKFGYGGDKGKHKRAKNIYATKKSKERREEPLETMSYQTSSKRSPQFWLLIGARKTQVFWHQSEARTAATVWNWSGKTLSPGALLAVLYFSSLHIYFPARLDFPSPPLSAPGSPRMSKVLSLD